MNIAVTGFKGHIGRELIALGCVPFDANVLDEGSVRAEFKRLKPDVIIHCAMKGGNDAVEWAEKNYDSESILAVRGTGNISGLGVPAILVSSDYVFDGKRGWYKEDDISRMGIKRQLDLLNNLTEYGFIKATAETIMDTPDNHIVRLSRTFASDDTEILDWIENLKNGHAIDVPVFFYRSYAHRKHVAQGLKWVAEHIHIMPKILNVAGTKWVSAVQFAKDLCDVFGFDKKLIIERRKENGEAKRPHKLGLDVSLARKLGVPLYSHIDGLKLLKEELA